MLLHYPGIKINAANTDVDVMCSAAWNVFVALFKKGDSGWIEIIAADKIMRLPETPIRDIALF